MGMEALSRGAPYAIFVEADHRTGANIRRNLAALELAGVSRVLTTDARRAFATIDQLLGERRVSAAFVDPPFMNGFVDSFLPHLAAGRRVFAPDALIIVRSDERRAPLAVPGLHLVESRSGGNATLYLYRPALTAEDAADGP
jgi:16S rRNA (guanine966-N2)-methyltransferase